MMKKSQILAAIALAMALGVVAPVMNSANSAYAVEQTAMQKAQIALNEAKDLFGPIVTYEGGVATLRDGEAYDFYTNNISTIVNAEQIVANMKKSGGAASVALKDAVLAAFNADAQAGDPAADIYEASEKTTLTAFRTGEILTDSFSDIVTFVRDTVLPTMRNIKATKTDEAKKVAIQAQIEAVETAISATELQKIVNQQIQTGVDGKVAAIRALYQKLNDGATMAAVDAMTEADLNTAIAGAKAKLPKIALYNATKSAIAELAAAIAANASDETLNDRVTDLKTAIAAAGTTGTGTGTGTGTDEATEDTKAPNTGIVGTAEGTATTVSIVAGLATALTALGAGVVAYRSARRK